MSKYGIEVEQHARAFKALGNPHRLALFQRLTRCCPPGTVCDAHDRLPQCVGDIGVGLGIAPSTLSHHLKTLVDAGLVATRRRGKRVECWVDPTVLTALAALFAEPSRQGVAS